ncbi:sensor histidine kinase [Xiamenia xianingshaonis]|nr:histidine kinase [Xiamenia xianingshaonis]
MENETSHTVTMQARDWVIDVLVAGLAYLFGCGQLLITASSIIIQDVAFRQLLGAVSVMPTQEVYIALAVTTAPLVLRRLLPWPVFLFSLASFLVLQYNLVGLSFTVIGPAIAIYTIVEERGISQGVAAGIIAVIGLLFVVPLDDPTSVAVFTRFQNIAFVVTAVIAGYAYRTHRAYVKATEARAAEAERTREEEAARRVEEERVRIAREVHDITAHSLSAVAVQAAAAERLIDRNPQAAKEAIATVRATAKTSLDDIRSMIGVLRHGDDPAETMPTRGTNHLPDLVDYLKDAGIDATFAERGYDRAIVPAHIDMGLFGIAREACTNMVKHSNARHARLTLTLEGGVASLEVADDGRGSGTATADGTLPRGADGGGHGIQGMAERTRLLGGTFEAGDSADGGFRIRASIPLRGTADS